MFKAHSEKLVQVWNDVGQKMVQAVMTQAFEYSFGALMWVFEIIFFITV